MSFPFHDKSVSFPTLISKPAIWNLNKTPMKLIQLETLLDMFLMMYGRDTIDANKKQYYLPGLEETNNAGVLHCIVKLFFPKKVKTYIGLIRF